MREISRINHKVFVLLACGVITCAVVSYAGFVFAAGLEITVTGGNWAIPVTLAAGGTATSANNWVITGAPDGTEDIDIRVMPAGGWGASTTGSNGVNTFVLRENNVSGLVIKSTDVRLKCTLARQPATYSFRLYFQAPNLGSESGSHTLAVTLTAKNFTKQCPTGAYAYDTDGGVVECWFKADKGQSCTAKCSNVGTTCVAGNWNDTTSCDVMKYLGPGTDCYVGGLLSYHPLTYDIGTYHNYHRDPSISQDCNAAEASSFRICNCDF